MAAASSAAVSAGAGTRLAEVAVVVHSQYLKNQRRLQKDLGRE